ncbi:MULTISPECIES: efflux RND transporter periplasmic adaptor subunit [unclassified Janthinobacterium]|uniref:efflux RND transporter periplasmic adaptor subunit n=1 Tax=unclassified Janthinobacterium TaxID=2610881 RepID=UPI0016096D0C|nr:MULTISPECIES: efflux RND transporter periplasmic adaptor subunit [unclassified Janthinobacterium]MBB5609606.1 multidrug efflux system membrane fusion protein [Janthinobacterium sp. S3T4]MBB5614778.1 multidrug efflux system membrane fusion protein [Janthinobacterium sp. S3M3]
MNTKIAGASALLITLAVAGVSLYPRAASHAADAAANPATKVALVPVVSGTQERFFNGVGELEAVRQVQVAAETGGRVTHIAFESGQKVAAGAVLVQLNDAPEQAALLRLRAQLKNAESSYARTRQLLADKVATQEQLDAALATRDAALGEVRQTVALIAQKSIRAPFAGQLGIRRVHAGQYLNPADAIASLIDTQSLLVNFALDEQSSAALAPGQAVQVLVDAYPGRVFTAKIKAIDPLIARSRMVQVQAALDNPAGALKAGMYASVRVAREQEKTTQLTVPETAVTYSAYGDTVFVAQQDAKQGLIVKRVAVTLGERADGKVVIAKGLQAGQRVVASGQLRLADGMAVQAVPNTLDQAQQTQAAAPTHAGS